MTVHGGAPLDGNLEGDGLPQQSSQRRCSKDESAESRRGDAHAGAEERKKAASHVAHWN